MSLPDLTLGLLKKRWQAGISAKVQVIQSECLNLNVTFRPDLLAREHDARIIAAIGRDMDTSSPTLISSFGAPGVAHSTDTSHTYNLDPILICKETVTHYTATDVSNTISTSEYQHDIKLPCLSIVGIKTS